MTLIDDIKDMYGSLTKLVGGDQDKAQAVYETVHKHGLSEKAYAYAFKVMFYDPSEPQDCIAYSTAEKKWFRGNKPISDLELISVFCEAVYLVKQVVEMSWKIAQYGAIGDTWLNQKEYARTELIMDDIESFAKIRSCLKAAAAIMVKTEDEEATVDWGSVCGGDEDEEDIGVEISFPEDNADVIMGDDGLPTPDF